MGNRATAVLTDGRRLRIALPFSPAGPLPKLALQALSAVLPAATVTQLSSRLLSTPGMRLCCSSGVSLNWHPPRRVGSDTRSLRRVLSAVKGSVRSYEEGFVSTERNVFERVVPFAAAFSPFALTLDDMLRVESPLAKAQSESTASHRQLN